MDKLSKGIASFAFDIFKSTGNNEENVFLSPWNISLALSILASGANGNSQTELIEALHLDEFEDQTEIEEAFEHVIEALSECPLFSVNRLYLKEKSKVNPEFVFNIPYDFKCDAIKVNFSKNVEGEIDAWVADQANFITEPLAPGTFDDLTSLALFSAVYFRGKWAHRFRRNKTKMETFYLSNGTKTKTKMMNLTENLGCAKIKEFDCKIFRLPFDGKCYKFDAPYLSYEGNRVATYVILPNQKKGLGRLKEILTADLFETMKKSVVTRKMQVKLPVFQIKFQKNLVKNLKTLNVKDILNEGEADLTIISPTNGLYASHVIHQAFITVDERSGYLCTKDTVYKKGLERKTSTFFADHPFIFIIQDAQTKVMLYIGTLDHP